MPYMAFCYTKKRKLFKQKMEQSMERLERELDLVKFVRTMRFHRAAIRVLLTKDQAKLAKQLSQPLVRPGEDMIASSDSESATEWFRKDPLSAGCQLMVEDDPVSMRLIEQLRKEVALDEEPDPLSMPVIDAKTSTRKRFHVPLEKDVVAS